MIMTTLLVLMHRHIFVNPSAGLPLMLYVGEHTQYVLYRLRPPSPFIYLSITGSIPLDITDSLLTKMIESCGKISKLNRPVDPTTQLPAVSPWSMCICLIDDDNNNNDDDA